MTPDTMLSEFRVSSSRHSTALSPDNGYVVINPSDEALIAGPLAKLRSFQSLHVGWNQSRGRVFAQDTLRVANEVLLNGILQFRISPDVMPLEDGGILIEWEHGDRALQVDVRPDGQITYGFIIADELDAEGQTDSKLSQLRNVLFAKEPEYA